MLFVFFLFLVLLTLTTHEGAHALIVWFSPGKTVSSFRPYPSFVEVVNGAEPNWFVKLIYKIFKKDYTKFHFYWASMRWDSTTSQAPTSAFNKCFFIAPCIKASITLVVSALLAIKFWPFAAFCVWELADVINFIQGYARNGGNDGGRFRRA
jgi:hypothetical protein